MASRSLSILRTLPLSGRQGELAISADTTVACPLERLVRSVASLQVRSADLRQNGRSHIIQGVTNGIVCLPCRR
jgi:hypothetical protein